MGFGSAKRPPSEYQNKTTALGVPKAVERPSLDYVISDPAYLRDSMFGTKSKLLCFVQGSPRRKLKKMSRFTRLIQKKFFAEVFRKDLT